MILCPCSQNTMHALLLAQSGHYQCLLLLLLFQLSVLVYYLEIAMSTELKHSEVTAVINHENTIVA